MKLPANGYRRRARELSPNGDPAQLPSPDAVTLRVVLSEDRIRALRSRALGVLTANWRAGTHPDGTEYAFTCPSPPKYRHQWYWDSCFHAIAWRHFDPARAREELRTLLRSGRLDGFIPHTVFWHEPARWRRAPLYATHAFRGSKHTASIQTPLIALAWEIVAGASADEP